MNYKVKIDNVTEIEVTSEEISNLDCIETSALNFHIIRDNISYKAKLLNKDFNSKTYTIAINNTPYTVAIKNDLDDLIKSMGFELGSKKQVNSIKAPMPGLILDINVEVGQEVNENDTLLILEAMKMENSITSPITGIIKSINAKKGDAVEKNHLLLEFE